MGNCLSRPGGKSKELDYHPEPRMYRRRRESRRPRRYEASSSFVEENPQCIPKNFRCCCNCENGHQPIECRRTPRGYNHKCSNRLDASSEEEICSSCKTKAIKEKNDRL